MNPRDDRNHTGQWHAHCTLKSATMSQEIATILPILKDPICGMPVDPATAINLIHEGKTFYFCSELCRQEFGQRPSNNQTTVHDLNLSAEQRLIAYFSMEIAIDPRMPTYAGGLGVLAGDALRSSADLHIPIVAVTLLHRSGYFDQHLKNDGTQEETPVRWAPEQVLRLLPGTVDVTLRGRQVRIQAWQYDIRGHDGYLVPILLLDTDIPTNNDEDRHITDYLYGNGPRLRLLQEAVLGIGGVRILQMLKYTAIQKFHLNEGHASLAAVELLFSEAASKPGLEKKLDYTYVQNRCIFTTHTPVPAGHDQFEYGLVKEFLGATYPEEVLRMIGGPDRMNMTQIALNLSHFVNGVALKHQQMSEGMFPGYEIHHVTNGVHSGTWTCESFRDLYDRYVPVWREDPAMLRQAASIPAQEVWKAHQKAKQTLIQMVKDKTGAVFSPDVLTIGCARRATIYKRLDLIFHDLARLKRIAENTPMQIIFAGKAHPSDEGGKALIRDIFAAAKELGSLLPVVYLPNYNTEIAQVLTAGADLWLNTPLRPLEASGTSGMKAAHNGVPSFSVLDGWWIEGNIEGITGWSMGGKSADGPGVDERDADDLYGKLEHLIAPLFYTNRARWISVMKGAISLNASFFNTHRVVQQYVTHAYLAVGPQAKAVVA